MTVFQFRIKRLDRSRGDGVKVNNLLTQKVFLFSKKVLYLTITN
jgi:hypothetical protein